MSTPTGAAPIRLAIIIGAMKCGTSNLFRLLAQHPQVSACRVKEPNYFGHTSMDRTSYLSLFEPPPEGGTLLEASTRYTKAPGIAGVPRHMAEEKHFEYRFVYLMRHPVARIESHVRQGLYQGFSQPLGEGDLSNEIALTRYAFQLDQYLEFFPRSTLLLLTLEEFNQTPHRVLRRVCRHIGIDEHFEFREVEVPHHTGERYQNHDLINHIHARKGLGRPLYWPFRMLALAARSTLPQTLYLRLKERVLRKNRGRYRLNFDERKEVLSVLDTDLERLRLEFGVDIDRYWFDGGSLPTRSAGRP